MSGYERITEDEHAASAATCCQCGNRTRHFQGADDKWLCATCHADMREAEIAQAMAVAALMRRRAEEAEKGRAAADERIEELAANNYGLIEALDACVAVMCARGLGDTFEREQARAALAKARSQ